MFGSRVNLFEDYTYILITYCLLFFALAAPFLLLGEVTAPHRQYTETGAAAPQIEEKHIENRKFGDYTHAYIPEIFEHLRSARSSWLTLWTNQNELGRPVYHLFGYSPAYFPSWIIARFTDNPWRFITIMSLSNCFLAGIFVILFCREIGLSPLAGLIAGFCQASSPLLMYWLTFPMFLAVWCWAAGALLGLTRIARKSDLVGWSLFAFSTYSLLMTAYQQLVVFHAYILAGYGLYLFYRKQQLGWRKGGRFLALSVSALITGTVLALPVYIDLMHIAAESARIAPDPSFFTVVLPRFGTLIDALRFVVLGTTPELFGNPINSNYPFSYNGFSVTILVIFFAIISLSFKWRQIWGWWLVILILSLLAIVHPLYVLGVKYLGFNLSRSSPLACIMLPLTIIVAYGADTLVKRSIPVKLSQMVKCAAAGCLAVITLGVSFGLSQTYTIRWEMVWVMFILVALLFSQQHKTRPLLLIAALIIVLITISYPLMLRQDPSHIAMTSSLIDKVRINTPMGSRFAVAAPGLSVLPPNLNAGLGLPSVHSYNSLSSTRYHALIKELGGEMQTYGRWNGSISPDYSSATFWMSNISLILSAKKIIHENIEYLGEESGINLHKVISRMGDSLQIVLPRVNMEDIGSIQLPDPRLSLSFPSHRRLDHGDLIEFVVNPGPPSILVLSQKFHCDWQAQIFDQSGWGPAQTTVVNGVFQGVILPQNVQAVRLQFKPFVCYAWVAHVFWMFLLALLGFRAWHRKENFGEEGY